MSLSTHTTKKIINNGTHTDNSDTADGDHGGVPSTKSNDTADDGSGNCDN